MRYISIIIITVLGFAIFSIQANQSKEDIIPLIRQVATDYRAAEGFEGACSVNGTEYSLGALIYALTIQEGGWKPGTVGYRTNNWMSVGGSRGKFPVTYINADGRKDRASFQEPYHGLYEGADLIVNARHYNGCNIGYKQLFAYIAGPNQSPNHKHPARGGKTAQQWVNYKLGLLQGWAAEYDNKKDSAPVAPANVKTKPAAKLPTVEDDTKRCHLIDHTGMDFIQIDKLTDGSKEGQVHNTSGEIVKVFKCQRK